VGVKEIDVVTAALQIFSEIADNGGDAAAALVPGNRDKNVHNREKRKAKARTKTLSST
jgi:hypothetical protein